MKSGLSASHRDAIEAIAATVFPGYDSQPAAADIELQAIPLDSVLTARPELIADFIRVIDSFHGDSDGFLQNLPVADYSLLMTVLCAAYVMDDRVRNALGYDGQQALTPNRGGFGCEELVAEMLEQPKRYRR